MRKLKATIQKQGNDIDKGNTVPPRIIRLLRILKLQSSPTVNHEAALQKKGQSSPIAAHLGSTISSSGNYFDPHGGART